MAAVVCIAASNGGTTSQDLKTGYLVGGTSPFGVRKAMPVYVEASVLALERIYINGGRRGFLVSLAPDVLTTVLNAQPVHCANPD